MCALDGVERRARHLVRSVGCGVIYRAQIKGAGLACRMFPLRYFVGQMACAGCVHDGRGGRNRNGS